MKKFVLLPLVLAFSIGQSSGNPLDDKLTALSMNQAAIKSGEQLYMQVCAACHNKDLSGATGFNLKDGEWVHGEKPSQILANIKQGFNKAGMPAFGAMFSEDQLEKVAAFIMSKREGLADLTYRIYQMDGENDFEVTENKLIKQGELPKNLMDFELPEIKYYTIEFEGILYAPKKPSKLLIEGWKLSPTKLEIDGEEVAKDNPNRAAWSIKPGKQKFKFQYIVSKDTLHHWKKNLIMYVTTDDFAIKLFGLSTRSHKIMLDKKVHVTADDKVAVQRKKIHNLPTYSISVGFPEKINYAFNTRSCNLVGLWTGDLLNVGPNVESRGKDGSIILGEWLVNKNDNFAMQSNDKCQYQKMTHTDSPAFFFSQNGMDFKLTTSKVSAQGLTFNYQILSNNTKPVTFELPSNGKVQITSAEGKVVGNRLTATPENASFSINISAN